MDNFHTYLSTLGIPIVPLVASSFLMAYNQKFFYIYIHIRLGISSSLILHLAPLSHRFPEINSSISSKLIDCKQTIICAKSTSSTLSFYIKAHLISSKDNKC